MIYVYIKCLLPNKSRVRFESHTHPWLQGASIFTGVFKEAAAKGSGKIRRKKSQGQDSEENSYFWARLTKFHQKSDKKLALRPRVAIHIVTF